MSTHQEPSPNLRSVFLIHGRNQAAQQAVTDFCRALDLVVVSWSEARSRAVKTSGNGSPYVGDIVRAGMDLARGVVVLFTPDDVARVHHSLRHEHDPEFGEVKAGGQARLNVVFEAGLALGIDRSKVLIVTAGRVREISDISGVHFHRLEATVKNRNAFLQALKDIGLETRITGSDWLERSGDFAAATAPMPSEEGEAYPFGTKDKAAETLEAIRHLAVETEKADLTFRGMYQRNTHLSNLELANYFEGDLQPAIDDSRAMIQPLTHRVPSEAIRNATVELFESWDRWAAREADRLTGHRGGSYDRDQEDMQVEQSAPIKALNTLLKDFESELGAVATVTSS